MFLNLKKYLKGYYYKIKDNYTVIPVDYDFYDFLIFKCDLEEEYNV